MEFILSFICGAYVAIVLIALIKSGKESDASMRINKALEYIKDYIVDDSKEGSYQAQAILIDEDLIIELIGILKGDD